MANFNKEKAFIFTPLGKMTGKQLQRGYTMEIYANPLNM